MTADRTLKVCTVGAGYFSAFHHAAWAGEPRVALAAVCDRDVSRAEAFAERFGAGRAYRDAAEMLERERPDLLDIASPPPSHAPLIALAADAGVAVVCQKPFTGSLQEARASVARAKSAGVMLAVHENFRFAPWYRVIRRLIEEEALGALYQATFRLRPGDGQGASAYLNRQPYFQTMPRFLVHETAIHLIDVFRYLLGEPDGVYADLRRLNPCIAGEDAGTLLFDYDGGRRALFDGNRLSDHVAQNRRLTMGEFALEGAAATVTLNGDGSIALRHFGKNDAQPVAVQMDKDAFAGGAVAALQAHVIDHIVDGAPLENAGADYLKNLEWEEAVYRSAEERRRIALF